MGGNRQSIVPTKKQKNYKIYLSKDALLDIKETKKYILSTFHYREYSENFSRKIKKAIKQLSTFPTSYEKTGYIIDGLEVYFKPYHTHLIFFVVQDFNITVVRILKERMYWQSIIQKIQQISR